MCVDGNATYAIGEKIKRGCEEQCLCSEGGKINCEPMCQTPLVRAGRKSSDPFCHARELPENPCCAILVCADSGNSFCLVTFTFCAMGLSNILLNINRIIYIVSSTWARRVLCIWKYNGCKGTKSSRWMFKDMRLWSRRSFEMSAKMSSQWYSVRTPRPLRSFARSQVNWNFHFILNDFTKRNHL